MSSLSPVPQSSAGGQTVSLPPWLQSGLQQNITGGIGGLGGYNLYNPSAAGQLTANAAQNPFAPGLLGSVGGGALQGEGAASNLYGYGNQILKDAFDPQGKLYNRYLGLTEQQANAQMAQQGLGTSPYAAGLNFQGLQNFNMDWQNQQLQRETQGLGAAGQAYGQALPLWLQSAMAPYQAYQGVNADAFSALTALQQYGMSAAHIPQQQIADWAQLLGLQPQLAGAQNKTAAEQSALQQTELQQVAKGISTVAGLGGAGLSGAGFSGPGTSMLNFLGGAG